MRFLVKNKTLLLIFILVVLIAGCSSSSTSTNSTSSIDTPGDNKSSLPKSDYPAAPAGIMQAQLKKTDGTGFKLEDYKGKVLLVNLWATWCGPCKAEMPEFVKLQEANKDKGFEVIGINIEDEETADIVKDFGEKNGINYELVKGDPKLPTEFLRISKVDAIPQSFLIDRDGKLVGVFVGGGQNVEKIKTSVGKIIGS